MTYGIGINNKAFTVNTSNNRLGVPSGQSGVMSYDAAGNLTNDTYTGAGNRTYDAENKIVSAWGGNNQAQLYGYDANGQRIKRTVDGITTWQVYGFGGELLAEYAANGATASPQKEYGYRNGQLLITADAPVSATNVALAVNGATVSASSTAVNPPYSYPISAVNNGDRKGLNAGFGGNWLSSTATFPQWVQLDFNGSKTISEIDVFSLQDNYASPIEPTETTTFSLYGLTAFDVQYWNGSTWTTVPGGSVTGNNKVWKKISFASLTTSKIRVLINASVDGWSRMVEVEAWTGSPTNINWLVTDHLGTPRMIIDQTGTLANVKRHDYLPFGEELVAPTGGRSAVLGYTNGEGIRQQFTSKERDIETGMDYFGARYYASTQGRFTSSDPLLASGRTWAPQSWNRYSYVLNNPLRLIDRTGLADDDTQNPKKQDEQPKPVAVDQITVGGVTVKVEQMNEPAGFQKIINGSERVGVGVQLNFTVTDENGKPVEGATAVESVSAQEGSEVKQNSQTVPLDSQGRGSDFVTNSAAPPKNRAEAQAVVQQIKDPFITKQEFSLTITLKSGTQVEVTQVRTLTNTTPDGKLQPEDRGLGFGSGVPGYTFTMEKMKGRVLKP